MASASAVVGTVTSSRDGAFAFTNLHAGRYTLRATAPGYDSVISAPFVVSEGATVRADATLAAVSGATLRTIGTVAANGRGINTSTLSITELNQTDFLKSGTLRVDDALAKLPGVDIQRFGSSEPGAQTTLSIRGAGTFSQPSELGSGAADEILVMVDGQPLTQGLYGTFDLSTLTPAIYSHVELLKGVGATTLYGAPTIAGVLNPLHTYGATLHDTGATDLYFQWLFTGVNNPLNQPGYSIFNAGASRRIGPFTAYLAFANLFATHQQAFTINGAGLPYPGFSGPYPTDLYGTQPSTIQFTLVHKWGAMP